MVIGLNILFCESSQSSMYINICFLTNFVITKSLPSLSNTEIPCKLFLAIVFNSYDWLKSFSTKNHLLKMEFKWIFVGFNWRILRVKMKTFLCKESVLHHNKRNCVPFTNYDHYLIEIAQAKFCLINLFVNRCHLRSILITTV